EAPRGEGLGVRVARVRLGIALDRDGGALGMMAPAFRLGLGGKLGSGRQWISWLHREDAVGLIRHALDHPALSGPVNGCAPEPVRNAEFTRELGKALRRPTIFPVPPFALRLVFGKMADTLLGGQRAIPQAAQDSGYTFRYPTLDGALKEIFT
ncbi:MAG: DUF1731 domain-containing protein, partial [Armatimonadetes bacterium]|nr:DUF1731 domain-containing protein [Armatimonadota bacterium]